MKILLVIHYEFNRNAGAAGVTWQLGQAYQQLGHEVYYYSFDDLPKELPNIVKRIVFPEFVAYHIWKLTKEQKIDVVDASTGDTWLWSKLLSNRSKHPPLIVARDHGLEYIEHLEFLEDVKLGKRPMSWQYPLYRGSIRLWEEATSLYYADLVLLLNRNAQKYAIAQLGVKPEKTRLIINGIPESFLNLPLEPTSIAEEAEIRIAQIGTYIPRKGIQYSVPALNRILNRYPQVKIGFFGTKCRECQDPAQVYADFDPAVRDRVKVIPYYRHKDLPNLLQGYHIKLFPSTSEAFGMALVEAMACGLAPITTATPGPLEIISNGYDGLVIPPRDDVAIEEALNQLICDRPYLKWLRRNARATAQNYSWDRIARQTLIYYQEALSRLNK
ncbi:MAG: glycosyltransferase family 4 protein [Hydrococcus sp. RU_2_2]|jgi:glycosyltransferase involved in cell wall biosynthesis|nr:glycosyltransferase family 4 protein [Hydrococcus sp. RU_2_2]NJP20163.1 glycosyltransferase family 4 protein [Hydrococcus sp. CRU_1_1]